MIRTEPFTTHRLLVWSCKGLGSDHHSDWFLIPRSRVLPLFASSLFSSILFVVFQSLLLSSHWVFHLVSPSSLLSRFFLFCVFDSLSRSRNCRYSPHQLVSKPNDIESSFSSFHLFRFELVSQVLGLWVLLILLGCVGVLECVLAWSFGCEIWEPKP